MPKTSKKRTRPAHTDVDMEVGDGTELDETKKRRLRNRLSQRHFRERKSMYIKELEERSKLNAKSESERNKALVQEVAHLRKTTLKLRSQVLKIAVALNAIGAEAGRILDVHKVGQSGRESTEESGGKDAMSGDTIQDTQPFVGLEVLLDVNATHDTAINVDPGPARAVSGEEDTSTSPRDEIVRATTLDQPDTNIPQSDDPDDSPAVTGSTKTSQQQNDAASDVVVEGPEPSENRPGDEVSEPEPLALISKDGYEVGQPFVSQEDLAMPLDDMEIPTWSIPEFWIDNAGVTSNWGDSAVDIEVLRPINRQGTADPLYNPFPMAPSRVSMQFPRGLLPIAHSKSPQMSLFVRSMFSEHVETLEHHVRMKIEVEPNISRRVIYQYCIAIMSLFAQKAWPSTYSVWFKSQVPEIIGPILRWRLHPTTEALDRLPAEYKPTELQLSVPHSAIIDWVPYAALRDRILICYNGSAALDRLMCDMMNNYVIEVNDVSQILPQAPSGKGYFGIWNLFDAIGTADSAILHSATDFPIHANVFDTESVQEDSYTQESVEDTQSGFQSCFLPSSGSFDCGRMHRQSSASDSLRPFNIGKILTTPALALKLSHDIRLFAAKSWRFDKSLFETWPELKFDGYENVVAQGRSYRVPKAPPASPILLTEETVKFYHNALERIS